MKNIIKAFLPSFMKNFIFRFYIILLGIIPKYISSQKFWSRNVVDAPNNGFSDIINSTSKRSVYLPLSLSPLSYLPKVISFKCDHPLSKLWESYYHV